MLDMLVGVMAVGQLQNAASMSDSGALADTGMYSTISLTLLRAGCRTYRLQDIHTSPSACFLGTTQQFEGACCYNTYLKLCTWLVVVPVIYSF